MTKLTKSERETFEAIGAAICGSKDAAKTKKAKMPLVAGFIAQNHDALVEGLVIGKTAVLQGPQMGLVRSIH